MEPYILSRVLHVIGVVFWIGGVAFVTTVLIPAIRRLKDSEEQVSLFAALETRFAWQARVTTLLVGLTGFYMLHLTDGWPRFSAPGHWWLHAMVGVWLIFTVVLFIAEPLFLHKLFLRKAKENPVATFKIMQLMHVILLVASIVTVAGAVAGSHGWLLS